VIAIVALAACGTMRGQELPFGKNKQYLSSGVVEQIVGGWQLSGREACYSGTPFTVSAPDTSLNDGGTNTQTANQILPTVAFIGGVGPGAHCSHRIVTRVKCAPAR
jgi:hypothetical protein